MIFLIIGLGIVEIYLRLILFHGFPIGDGRLKDQGFYADYFSDDDYWKLQQIFLSRKGPKQFHPVLGWSGNFDSESYKHNDYDEVAERTPVLLYGDSFAQCDRVVCFQDILNEDPEFSRVFYLINYGVSGYGVDQIELLYEKSVGLYEEPVVIFTLLTEDLDRSILTNRSGQKPYYTMEDGNLVLNGPPLNPDYSQYLEENPLSISSYLWNFITHSRFIPEKIGEFLRDDKEKTEKKKILNEAILQKAIDNLRERKIPFFFVVFHADWPDPLDGPDSWRDTFLREVLDDNNVPYIWSKDIILKDARENGNDISTYFKPVGGHYTESANRLIAEEMKKMILNKNYETYDDRDRN